MGNQRALAVGMGATQVTGVVSVMVSAVVLGMVSGL